MQFQDRSSEVIQMSNDLEQPESSDQSMNTLQKLQEANDLLIKKNLQYSQNKGSQPLFDLTTSEILKDSKKESDEGKGTGKQKTVKSIKMKEIVKDTSQDPHSTKGQTIQNEFLSSLLEQREGEKSKWKVLAQYSNVVLKWNWQIFQILNMSIRDCKFCTNLLIENVLWENLEKKYLTSREYYNSKIVTDIIYNENTHIVSVFKDYLIFDDVSEFLKRSYTT